MTFRVQAQEAVDLQAAQREQKPRPSATAATGTPSPNLSPTTGPNVPDLSQIDEIFKQTSLGKEADEQRMHIEWRQLANRVVSDPEIVAAKKAAEAAHTDLERRERLRAYYNLYFGRMRAETSNDEMKRALDFEKGEHLKLLDQLRVRPVPGVSPTVPPSHHKKKDRQSE